MSASDPTQAQINAASAQGAAQSTAAAQSLAGAAAYDEFAGQYQYQPQAQGTAAPAAVGPEASHPAAGRLSSSKWAGLTGQQNHAQRAQPTSEVPWVTVPVDRIMVAPNGSASVTPVYANTQGYAEAPGESAGSIPPNFRRAN
jgi:hypothetical protein